MVEWMLKYQRIERKACGWSFERDNEAYEGEFVDVVETVRRYS